MHHALPSKVMPIDREGEEVNEVDIAKHHAAIE